MRTKAVAGPRAASFCFNFTRPRIARAVTTELAQKARSTRLIMPEAPLPAAYMSSEFESPRVRNLARLAYYSMRLGSFGFADPVDTGSRSG